MKPVLRTQEYWSPEDKPDPHEVLVGRSQAQRTTKTLIPDEHSATLLNIIQTAPRRWAKTLNKLRAKAGKPELTFEQMLAEYPGIYSWATFHHGETEHLGSVKGFLTQNAVRSYELRTSQAPREASHDQGGNGNGAAPKYDA